MLTARPASHSGNDACADAATASPHGVDTRACTALTVRAIVAMPLKSGSPASFITFDGLPPEVEHFAIRFAEAAENKVPLVRIHSECVTGDVFGSLRCDCGSPLEQSIEAVADLRRDRALSTPGRARHRTRCQARRLPAPGSRPGYLCSQPGAALARGRTRVRLRRKHASRDG